MAISGKPREAVLRALEMANGDANIAFELVNMDPAQLAAMMQ
jgi:hypothetical protein